MLHRKTGEFILTKEDVKQAVLDFIGRKTGIELELNKGNVSWGYRGKGANVEITVKHVTDTLVKTSVNEEE